MAVLHHFGEPSFQRRNEFKNCLVGGSPRHMKSLQPPHSCATIDAAASRIFCGEATRRSLLNLHGRCPLPIHGGTGR